MYCVRILWGDEGAYVEGDKSSTFVYECESRYDYFFDVFSTLKVKACYALVNDEDEFVQVCYFRLTQ